jgi:hypothetical protein
MHPDSRHTRIRVQRIFNSRSSARLRQTRSQVQNLPGVRSAAPGRRLRYIASYSGQGNAAPRAAKIAMYAGSSGVSSLICIQAITRRYKSCGGRLSGEQYGGCLPSASETSATLAPLKVA